MFPVKEEQHVLSFLLALTKNKIEATQFLFSHFTISGLSFLISNLFNEDHKALNGMKSQIEKKKMQIIPIYYKLLKPTSIGALDNYRFFKFCVKHNVS